MLYGSVGRVGLRALSGTSFSPLSLFAAGEQGVWLDNSDFTTLFQDRAGTIPVTGYEQFVGLRLDKSKGLALGSELVTNGGFATDSDWVKGTGWTISGGTANYDGTDAPNAIYQAAAILASGKSYRVSLTVVLTQGALLVRPLFNSTTGQYQINSSGTYSILLSGQGGSFGLVAGLSGARFIGSVDNISVRELPGNHAYQTNINARAVLSARYNLLTQTEAFNSGAWGTSTVGITPNAETSPIGTLTADMWQNSALLYPSVFQATVPVAAATRHTFSIYVKAGNRNIVSLELRFASGDDALVDASYNLASNIAQVFSSGATANVVDVGSDWRRLTLTKTNPGLGVTATAIVGGSELIGGDVPSLGLNFYIWGADLRVANESSALPAYQRVGAAVNGTSTSIGTPDYDTVGFPAYLRYDGGDWYQTNSIDFSAGATNPPLGPELVDTANTLAGWTAYTNNIVELDGDAIKVTFVDNSNGAFLTLTQLGGLTTNLTAGLTYSVTCQCKVNTGSVATQMVSAATNPSVLVTSTTFTDVSFSFVADGTNETLRFLGMSTGEIVWIRNISVKEIDPLYYPDKMSVFTGVRKLSDALSVIAELSSDVNSVSVNGAFILVSRLEQGYGFGSKGTLYSSAIINNGYPAPITNILTGLGNISGDSVSLRINAAEVASSTADQGTGTFGNYPLYIGARNAGASLPFTGREYETIILGRAVTAAELANTEDYMETQTFGKNMAYVYSDELTTATGDQITAADGDPIYMTVQYI